MGRVQGQKGTSLERINAPAGVCMDSEKGKAAQGHPRLSLAAAAILPLQPLVLRAFYGFQLSAAHITPALNCSCSQEMLNIYQTSFLNINHHIRKLMEENQLILDSSLQQQNASRDLIPTSL